MSEEKFYCERCGKELVFRCAYSRIDHKLICVECDDKEQPKELMKKIQELETKLADSEIIIKGGKEEIKDLHRKIKEIVERDINCIKQLKQQLKMALEDFNEIQKEHDKLCDMVVEKDKKIELLNKELSNECDEHLKFVGEADSMVKDLKKAFRFAIFELDFARHHSQSTTTETMERIERLTDEIWNKAMKIKGEL